MWHKKNNKMIRIFLLLGFVILISSCVDNTVYFDKPQPDGVKDLEQIPFWYRGLYIKKDSSFLIFNKTEIIRKYHRLTANAGFRRLESVSARI
jgi:hypothetical protein